MSLQEEAAGESLLSLLDLGAGPLLLVLRKLPLQDLCRTQEVCKALRDAAQNDLVWQAKALEVYPAETVRLGAHYSTYQELVRDDNAEQASLLLPLDLAAQEPASRQGEAQPQQQPQAQSSPGSAGGDRGSAGGAAGARSCSCRYKFNRLQPELGAGGFYECLALALEWDRAAHVFRLYIDARGEADLRQPGDSSLGFTVHRAPPPDRRALERRLAQLRERRVQLKRDLAAALARDAGEAIRRAEHDLARNATQRQATQLELGRQYELRFADLLTVVRPAGQELVVDRRGHKLGCLLFDSLHKIDVLLAELPDSYASKQQAEQCGLDLNFCYANPIPVMPHGALVDYEPCVVASVLPGSSLRDVFRRQGRYAVPGALLQQLESEGPEARRARWQHVPPQVLGRQPPWLV
ncbi:hypothetical protein ABPG75_008985 [Micractinium tetrahymenae]